MKRVVSLVLIIVGLAFCASCESKHNPKPEKFIKEKDMISLLTEIHLLEAKLQEQYQNNPDSIKQLTQENYDVLFTKYDISKVVFEENLKYYSFDTKNMIVIYQKVEDNLKKLDTNQN